MCIYTSLSLYIYIYIYICYMSLGSLRTRYSDWLLIVRRVGTVTTRQIFIHHHQQMFTMSNQTNVGCILNN